jgi:hypothetical protein
MRQETSTTRQSVVSSPLTSKFSYLLLFHGMLIKSLSRFGHSLVQIDPKVESRLRTKIDLYIIPTVSLIYLFCFIDRANVGK